jgi:phosphohistidine phosphatase
LLTSPLVRARQTADLCVEAGLAGGCEIFSALAPGGSLSAVRHWICERGFSGALGLVGHQPGLGLWAEELVCGSSRRGFDIKKAGVVRVTLGEAHSRGELVWMLSPRVLGV